MKTAMEELIDELKTISTQISKEGNIDMVAAFSYAIDVARLSIKKEKEQIIDAFNEGIDEMAFDTSGINYYNRTYNQNK